MPKIIKGTAHRKPPAPVSDHAVIDGCLANQMPLVQPLVTRLDEMIRAAIPDLVFAAPRGRPYYGLVEHGWIIELAAYHKSMNIVFFGGADFVDPPPLGDVDRSRYIKIENLHEAEQPAVADWIRQAAHTLGWAWPPE